MGKTHTTLPTPNPQLRSLAVVVQSSVLENNPFILPPRGTKYSEFKNGIITKDFNNKFGNYVYTAQTDNANGDAVLLFSPPISEVDSLKPYETSTRFGDHYWPPILKSIVFLQDRSFPRYTRGPGGKQVFAPRYYTREAYIPSLSEGTLFTTRQFLSATEPKIPQYDTPAPTRVSWDFLGTRGDFPECLHDRIIIPNLRTAFIAFSTSPEAASGVLTGQIFPATNFTDWQEYVVSDKAELVNGVWHRVQVTVTPPPEPEIIVR